MLDGAAVRMILFDLDGTLVDSVPDLTLAIDAMQAELGLPVRGEAAVRLWVGNGAARLVHRALCNDINGVADAELFARGTEAFFRHYAENATASSQCYPGVLDGLDQLRAAGYPLACVTNKPAQFTHPLLDALGLADYFGTVVCGDTLAVQKPSPEPLLYAADFFKVPPKHALMIGDSVNDVRAARAAGFAVVCVPYGYNHGEDIRLAQPDAVVERIDRLLPLLQSVRVS